MQRYSKISRNFSAVCFCHGGKRNHFLIQMILPSIFFLHKHFSIFYFKQEGELNQLKIDRIDSS